MQRSKRGRPLGTGMSLALAEFVLPSPSHIGELARGIVEARKRADKAVVERYLAA